MFKRYWRTMLITLSSILAAASMSAIAQGATPAETIKSRQQGLKAMGEAMKTIKDQLDSDKPDAASIRAAGAKVKTGSDSFSTWFPKGTGPEVGVETAAKPGIWSDPDDFAEKLKAFQTEAAKLTALTDSGDIEGLRSQSRKLSKACAACHDTYRVRKDS